MNCFIIYQLKMYIKCEKTDDRRNKKVGIIFQNNVEN